MKNTSLPENAYRELREGEEYKPIMSADTTPAEATPYSVTMGIIMAIIVSAAAAFLGLKGGEVFEAAEAREHAGSECYYTEYRCLLGCDCCRCYLYPAGALHPRT